MIFFGNSWPEITPSQSLYFVFLLNKVVFPRIFRFYLIFCVIVVLSTFGLLFDRFLVATFNLCESDSYKKDRFD